MDPLSPASPFSSGSSFAGNSPVIKSEHLPERDDSQHGTPLTSPIPESQDLLAMVSIIFNLPAGNVF